MRWGDRKNRILFKDSYTGSFKASYTGNRSKPCLSFKASYTKEHLFLFKGSYTFLYL